MDGGVIFGSDLRGNQFKEFASLQVGFFAKFVHRQES
jgi:hypothetical protein